MLIHTIIYEVIILNEPKKDSLSSIPPFIVTITTLVEYRRPGRPQDNQQT